jgi:hypothetical protein
MAGTVTGGGCVVEGLTSLEDALGAHPIASSPRATTSQVARNGRNTLHHRSRRGVP